MYKPSGMDGKKEILRNIIFDRGSISRQELIAASGYNERTVTRHADELVRQNLVREHRQSGGNRGRPSAVYSSNSENIFFLGVTVLSARVVFVAIDINNFPLRMRYYDCDESVQGSDLLHFLFDRLDAFVEPLSHLSTGGICLSISCDQFIRDASWGDGFVAMARQRYRVRVERHDNDALQLQRWTYKQHLGGRIAGLFCGHEFWMVLLEDGEINDKVEAHLNDLRHTVVLDKDAAPCFCGQSGCLGTALTYNGIRKRYLQRRPEARLDDAPVNNYNNLLIKGRQGDSAAAGIFRANGEILGRTAAKMRRELDLDHVVLMHIPPEVGAYASRGYREAAGEGASPLLIFRGSYADIVFAPAELAQRRLLGFDRGTLPQGVIPCEKTMKSPGVSP